MLPADLHIDKTWTLFLDRDGVINKKIDHDYVRNYSQFEFLPGVKDALRILNDIFGRIVIVTNQRGIGRGLMTVQDLESIHEAMMKEVTAAGGRIDAIYFCSDVQDEGSTHRKPQPGMALDAKAQFPEIDFSRSLMAGDSSGDMEFGTRLGMVTAYISPQLAGNAHLHYTSLINLANDLSANC